MSTLVLAGRVVDEIVAQSGVRTIANLAIIMAVIAVLDAITSVIVRWFSSRLGEGIIYDLRTAVFDHVQKMPVAFFARTRTGALVSRLNNDVIGAQSAFAGTLSGLVSNTVALILTAAVMFTSEPGTDGPVGVGLEAGTGSGPGWVAQAESNRAPARGRILRIA